MMTTSPRGFTLLIAVILSSVLVAVGLALVDIAYKHVILSSTARNYQVAFYNADSALECGLYADQQFNAFSATVATTSIRCNSQTVAVTASTVGAVRTSTMTIPCTPTGSNARVTITKNTSGATGIYATGYSSCATTDQRRVERGLKVTY